MRLDAPASRSHKAGARNPSAIVAGLGRVATSARGNDTGVEHQIRVARITDIDRLTSLAERATGRSVSADLLRQLVYLPQTSIFVAEQGRELSGGIVMALRPSVRTGGYIGSIDLLAVDPDLAAEPTADALLAEAIRSAHNKGCAVIEAAFPDDPVELARLKRSGFAAVGQLLARPLAKESV